MFVVEVPPGSTLLVDGEARVKVLSGECRVFGARVEEITVPEGKRLPFRGSCRLSVEGGTLKLVKGGVIPEEWNISVKGRVLIAGEMDTGKSSLATFLINREVSAGKRVVFIDLDCGQSDLGPPGFLARALVEKPVPLLQEAKPQRLFFFGSTTPTGWEDYFIVGLSRLLEGTEEELVIVNTPGWVSGRGIQLLESIKELLRPDTVLLLGELPLEGKKLPPSPYVKQRTKEDRTKIRSSLYRKYLKNLREVSVPAEVFRAPCIPLPVPRCLGRELQLTPEGLKGLFGALLRKEEVVGYCLLRDVKEKEAVILATTEDFDEVRLGRIKLREEDLTEECLL